MRRRLAELPSVETLYGWNAEAISQDARTATVTAAQRDGGRRLELIADYVVGCDGSRSLTRMTALGAASGETVSVELRTSCV